MSSYEKGYFGSTQFDPDAVIANLVDAIFMGIPSSAVVPEISRKYDIEIADLNRTYNQLNKELNNLMDKGISLSDAKNEIRDVMYQSGPLGAIRADLSKKYKEISREIEANKKEQDDRIARMSKTANKLAETQKAASRSSTLGGAWKAGDL